MAGSRITTPQRADPDAPAEDLAYLRRLLGQCEELDSRVHAG